MSVKLAKTIGIIFYLLLLKEVSVNADDLDPTTDYMLSFTEVLDKLGWNYEVHEVTTEDKYILQLFHLPGNKTKPIYLLSGNMGTADDYIMRGNRSLPAVLLDAGYDVWLGNWRGCRYGRRHASLDPDHDDEFWDFSFHEFALYDIPAQLDYVLNATQVKRMPCIAWSLGTTSFYVMGALRPEYIDKITVIISLAPFGYGYHSITLVAPLPFVPLMEEIGDTIDIQEICKYNSTLMIVLRYVCCSEELGYEICMKNGVYKSSGFDETNLEPEFTPLLFGHYPSSTSKKTLLHTLQGETEHRIAQYDYGRSQNLARYGSAVAPSYPLYKNNMTIVMISGLNDLVSTLPDVEFLKKRLPNVVEHIVLEPPEFNHFDFVYGKNSDKILHRKHILPILKKYST